MTKISDEVNKLILSFEENGFWSKFRNNSIALRKDIQKWNFKISVFYCLIETEGSSFETKDCYICLGLLINNSLEIENIINFREVTKCPMILQAISEFIIDLFILMEINEFQIGVRNTEYIKIRPKGSKNETTLDICFYDGLLEFYLQSRTGPVRIKYLLDEIGKKDSSVLFEELKNKILQFDTI